MVTAGKRTSTPLGSQRCENEEKEMDAQRFIGIDLHRDCFTACVRLENGREYLKKWKLEDMPKFASKLRPTDQVAPLVDRVVAVNPTQFQVITHSVKKTDPNDARLLALYLAKTRDTMVKLRTALKNKVNNICSAYG